MITKLPKWIEYGAFLLAFVAGCINAIGLLGFEHQSVSHLSGTATLIGASLLNHTPSVTLHLTGVVVAFFAGAALSGVLLPSTAVKLGRHYDTALAIEALLLLIAMYLLANDSFYGHFAASAACGLQNAMVTTYSGAIVRTTHLTGIITDLGIMLGSMLRGESFNRRRVLLFSLITLGFISGGAVGAYLFSRWAFYALMAPSAICALLALGYRIYLQCAARRKNRDKAIISSL
ncbi:YoaK family protein [Vibrio sp. WXL103]|uniref:YoaK family protein n=1 Tax=Vibrio sp. WXL103 TaxID=3450710 RepID=UPI003EC80442